MTDTPIIDAAIRAGCGKENRCRFPFCKVAQGSCELREDVAIHILRAANPWTPPVEEIEAMARATVSHCPGGYWEWMSESDRHARRAEQITAYRARPIMRELYPEIF